MTCALCNMSNLFFCRKGSHLKILNMNRYEWQLIHLIFILQLNLPHLHLPYFYLINTIHFFYSETPFILTAKKPPMNKKGKYFFQG